MQLWSITPATYYNSLLLTTYTTSHFFRSMLRVQFLRPGTKWDRPQNSWPSPEIHGGMSILGDFIKLVTLANRYNSYLWIIYVYENPWLFQECEQDISMDLWTDHEFSSPVHGSDLSCLRRKKRLVVLDPWSISDGSLDWAMNSVVKSMVQTIPVSEEKNMVPNL